MTPEQLATLRDERDTLERKWKDAGRRLKLYPRDASGLVLDSVKTPVYRADRLACDQAFAALQAFNKRHRKILRLLTS
jgi:hypothetical protein